MVFKDLTFRTDMPPQVWQDTLRRLHGNIFHTHEWMQTRLGDGGTIVCIEKTDVQGEVCAMALCRSVISRWPLLSFVDRNLVLEAPPVVKENNPEAILNMIVEIQSLARRAGYTTLNIRPFTSPLPAEALCGLGFDAKGRWELTLSLEENEEILWKSLRSGHRYSVKRGRKEDFQLNMETLPEAYLELSRLQYASQKRAQEKGNDYTVGNPDTYRHMAAVLGASGLGRIYRVFKGSDLLAAALITVFDRQAYYTLAGTNPPGYDLGAPAFLIWETALRLKAEGVALLNLGGVPQEAMDPDSPLHGVYRFKTGFGGHLVESSGGQCILYPVRYRLAGMARRGIKRLTGLKG